MYIIDLSNPYTITMALMVTLLCIILGREFKKSLLPAVSLGLFLILLVIHAYQGTVIEDLTYKSIINISMGVDATMIFLSYISYLWVDDIETKEKHKKSLDNSLEWFWKKV